MPEQLLAVDPQVDALPKRAGQHQARESTQYRGTSQCRKTVGLPSSSARETLSIDQLPLGRSVAIAISMFWSTP